MMKRGGGKNSSAFYTTLAKLTYEVIRSKKLYKQQTLLYSTQWAFKNERNSAIF